MNSPSKVILLTFFNDKNINIDIDFFLINFKNFDFNSINKIYIYNKNNK